MKPIKSLLVLALVCAPVVASAQGYYGPGGGPGGPVPGGFHNRMGRLTYGGAIGFGGMHDGGSTITTCTNCDVKPLAFEADGHIGGMLSPRFGLMLEVQVNAQTVQRAAFANEDTILSQGAVMIAGQYWLLPMLWVKGGVGIASLQVDNAYVTGDFGTGGAFLGAVGVELLSARNFALELQGRLIEGTYHSLNDNVTSGTIGIGINWY
jgi:hypothetical protein